MAPITKNCEKEVEKIKNITVLMQDSSNTGKTYPKRAAQLVKQGRAYWDGDAVICMMPQREDTIMDNSANINVVQNIEAPANNAQLFELATSRVEEKTRLIIGFLDLALLAFVFFIVLTQFGYSSDGIVLVGCYLFFIAIRLFVRVFKLYKSATFKGVKEYIKDRKEREIRIVYEKLMESTANPQGQ